VELCSRVCDGERREVEKVLEAGEKGRQLLRNNVGGS
jgi:hypothetical protein